MKRLLTLLLIIGSVTAVPISRSCADDLVPPPWRGQVGTTYQDWQFDTNANPAVLDAVVNPYGTPVAQIIVGQYGSGWLGQLAGLGTRQGYWDLGSAGTINVSLPNKLDTTKCKYIWAQVTCFKDISQPPVLAVPGAAALYQNETTVESLRTGGSWVLEQAVWRMGTSTVSEALNITSDAAWGSVVDEVVVDTVSAPTFSSVVEARQQPDGTLLELTGPVVTRKFETYFYVEDPDRTSGIRVNCSGSPVPAQGSMPYVLGTVRVVDGERVIDQAAVTPGSTGTIPGALAMNNRALLHGLPPQGLLIRLTGRAQVANPVSGTFLLDDGSEEPVTVEMHGAAMPADSQFVSITGVVGANLAGPVLRVNATNQMRAW